MDYANLAACLVPCAGAAAVSAAVYKRFHSDVDKRLYFISLAAALIFSAVFMFLKQLIWYFDILFYSVLFVLFHLCMRDIKEKEIPVLGIYILYFACAATMAANPYCGIVNNLITGAAVTLFLFIIYRGLKVSIGRGDVEVLGALAFAFGYPDFFSLTIAALFLSMLWGIGLMVLKKANIKMELPFIPFLFAGYVINIINF